jgi:hypothetical protein
MTIIANRIFTPFCQFSFAVSKSKKGRASAILFVACPDGNAGVGACEKEVISPAYWTVENLFQRIPGNPRNTEHQEYHKIDPVRVA